MGWLMLEPHDSASISAAQARDLTRIDAQKALQPEGRLLDQGGDLISELSGNPDRGRYS